MRRLFVTLVGLLLAGGGVAARVYSADSAEPGAGAATVSQSRPAKKIIATGTIEPEEVVEVSAQVAGRIVGWGADPHANGKPIDWGSSVEAGTVLAQIDSDLYTARVQRERAVCVRAEAELAQAKINLQRTEARWKHATPDQSVNKTVSDSGFEAEFNYKTAEAAVRVAEAVLAEKKAELRQAEIELGYTTVKSPIKGVIIDRRVNVGRTVFPAANSPTLFLVANIEKLQIWASVNEADIAKIHRRQRVRFTVDARPGKVFEGQVAQIRLNATMIQNVVTYTVVVDASPTDKLLPYLTGHLEFE
jgi:HlyD family secretion protein